MRQHASETPRWGEQVEGVQAVKHLLAASRREVECLYVARTAGKQVEELFLLAASENIEVKVVERSQIDAMARTAVPQGVVAICEPLQRGDLVDLATRAVESSSYLVALDGLEDPSNVGAAIRSACALGATGVLISEYGSSGMTPSAMKAAAGAAEYIEFVSIKNLASALRITSRIGLWAVVLDSVGVPIYDHPLLTEPLVLIAGSEGKGVSRLVAARADVITSIPLIGAIESLNVSAAIAAACSEIRRNRGERK